jgi:D-alanyl-D-alanine carboxypeptidase/D-alanyl-D-alanine-endopeptidase (penicillin-binding protein 4)
MSKFPLICLLFFCEQLCSAQDIVKIKDLLEKSPALKNAQYSIYAKYAGGADIISINPDLRLSPASVLKLYTTACALDSLGPGYRFKTEVYYSGFLKKDKLYGNIYIKGGGDPTLGSLRMADTPGAEELVDGWAAQIKALGIQTVEGNVYADNSVFGGVLLPWRTGYQNIGNYYAAPADGLSIRDNSYEIYFEPCREDGAHAAVLKTDPEIKGLKITSHVKAYRDYTGESAYVNFSPFGAEVHGSIPTSSRPLEISAAMPSPALFLAGYFKAALEAAGIKVKGSAQVLKPVSYEDKKPVLTHFSPPLADIVKYTNKRSFNLYADILLRALSAESGGPGTAPDGVGREGGFLSRLGIDNGDFDVFDGSGLSRDNITTCRITVSLLEAVLKQPYAETFLDSLPLAGDPDDFGNMSRRLRNSSAAFNARVKTGTLDRVRAHAGYAKDIRGKDMVFCIVTNNFKDPPAAVNQVHETVISAIAETGLNTQPTAKKLL